jgi:hypothetical protein
MALERLSQITESGIKTGITISNASVTGVLTAVNELKVGTGVTINSGIVTATGGFVGNLTGNVSATGASTFGGSTFSDNVGIKTTSATKTLDVRGDTQVADLYYTADYPTIRPSLDLVFDKVKRLDSRVTFTRNSVGTYVGTDGLIKTAAANEPRFDHDPVTGESLGLLIEEQRTNYIDNSNDLSQWNRVVNGATTTSNTTETLSPDGTNNSTKITGVTNSGMSRDSIISVSASTFYTASVFAKKGSADNFLIELGTGPNNMKTVFNINTKTFSSGSATGWFESYSTSYIDYPNGWVRVIISGTTSGSASGNLNLAVYGISSGYVYFWGAQAEQGAFSTSYIPTSGSTVTRSVDVASMTGTNFSDWYNQLEGTILSQHSLIDGVDNNNNCYVYQVDNGTNNEVAFRLIDKNTYYSNPSKLTATSLTSGSSITLLQKSSASSGTTLHSTSYAVKTNDFAVTFDGATVQTDDSGTLPSNQTTLSIGYNSPANTAQLNGHIKRLTYYPRRLNNSQLQNITL